MSLDFQMSLEFQRHGAAVRKKGYKKTDPLKRKYSIFYTSSTPRGSPQSDNIHSIILLCYTVMYPHRAPLFSNIFAVRLDGRKNKVLRSYVRVLPIKKNIAFRYFYLTRLYFYRQILRFFGDITVIFSV